MWKKQLFSGLLALCLVCSLVPASAAVEPDWLIPKVREAIPFSDTGDAWCREAVDTCYEAGLMVGKTGDEFDIQGPLTGAQIVTISARLLHLLQGGDGVLAAKSGEPWYQGAYDYLWAAVADKEIYYPIFFSKEHYQYVVNESCTREDFVRMLSYALLCVDSVELPAINQVTALPDVVLGNEFGNISGDIFKFYNAGILTGSDSAGTFHPSATLNRGQAAAILARLIDPQQRVNLTLKAFDLCRDVLMLDPETVLVTIDGVSITAGQACLRIAYNPAKEQMLSFLVNTVSMARLAEKRGLSVPYPGEQEQVWPDGYRGVGSAGWRWEAYDTALYNALYASYNNGASPDPHFSNPVLSQDIKAIADTLPVETSSVLDTYDFDAFRARLSASVF